MNQYAFPSELLTTPGNRHLAAAKAASSQKHVVTLQPVAKRIPNRYNVYSPSKLESKKEVSYEEFLTQYAQYPRAIRICFDELLSLNTILQRSQIVTAYPSINLNCWYIIDSQ